MNFYEDLPFSELLFLALAGDAGAADHLVTKYGRSLRTYVHVHLTSPRLRRLLDSTDITQVVWKSFFERARKKGCKVDSPDHLVKLLVRMAQRRLAKELRHHRARRRDVERQEDGTALEEVASSSPGPVKDAEWNEFRELLRDQLEPEMWRAFELRLARHSWEEIAEQLGGTPDRWRMGLERALLKALKDLGMNGMEDLP